MPGEPCFSVLRILAPPWHKGGTRSMCVLFLSPAGLCCNYKLGMTSPKVPSGPQQELQGRNKQQFLESHHGSLPGAGGSRVQVPHRTSTNLGPEWLPALSAVSQHQVYSRFILALNTGHSSVTLDSLSPEPPHLALPFSKPPGSTSVA